jgi:hypothetical protein
MEKEFVPYELAVKLKTLGFDEPCLGRYYNEEFEFDPSAWNSLDVEHITSAPLFQQAFRWFREKGYLISFSSHDTSIHDFYIKWQPSKSILSDTYDTCEEAETACLQKLIEIVEQTNAEMTDHGVYK